MTPETVLEDLSQEILRLSEDKLSKNMAEINRDF
mgnify:CR=1 FL=1